MNIVIRNIVKRVNWFVTSIWSTILALIVAVTSVPTFGLLGINPSCAIIFAFLPIFTIGGCRYLATLQDDLKQEDDDQEYYLQKVVKEEFKKAIIQNCPYLGLDKMCMSDHLVDEISYQPCTKECSQCFCAEKLAHMNLYLQENPKKNKSLYLHAQEIRERMKKYNSIK